MGRVLVLGSINRDIVVCVPRIPRPGETVLGNSSAEYPGGKGANQAVAAQRMGADVALIGATGDDGFGAAMRAFLAQEGINLDQVAVLPDVPTGIALITVESNGENAITVSPGANARVGEGGLPSLDLKAGDYLVCQFEIPLSAVMAGFQQARASGARSVLNPAPMQAISPDLLALTDILVLNEHELAQCTGIADASSQPIEAMAELARAHPDLVVIATLGARGCIALAKGEITRIAGEPVPAIDTTGAGDCFVGALAALLAQGLALEQALRLANRAAGISVTRKGAASSMPMRAEILG